VLEKLEKSAILFQGSAILAQKCEIMDFSQMVHNNAILLKECDLVRFLPKSAGSPPHTFPDALYKQHQATAYYKSKLTTDFIQVLHA